MEGKAEGTRLIQRKRVDLTALYKAFVGGAGRTALLTGD
jgi:hypothetical protein